MMFLLGIFLRDFTFIDVGNEDYADNEFVNYEKMQLIAEVVTSFLSFQNAQYYFQLLGNCTIIYKISLPLMKLL